MYESLHARLAVIATEDSDREVELGSRCPARLWLKLAGGHELVDCHLADGLNSLDDETIDVIRAHEPDPERGIVWIVPLAQIAAIRLQYPLERERAAAAAKGPR